MDARLAAYRGAILHHHVPGQPRVVDDDHLVADHAVVSHVAGGHDEAARADDRVVPVVGGAVDGHVLADRGLLPDGDPHGVAGLELQILRLAADDGAVTDAAACAQGHRPFQHHVSANLRIARDAHLGADHAVGTDAHARVHLGAWIHDGGGMQAGAVSHRDFPRAHAPVFPARAPCARAPAASSPRPRCGG